MNQYNSENIVVSVNDVTVRFNMASERIDNLKEYFVKIVKRELMFKEFLALKNISFEALPEIKASICKDEKLFYLKREDMKHIEHRLGDFYIFFDGDICVSFCVPKFSGNC